MEPSRTACRRRLAPCLVAFALAACSGGDGRTSGGDSQGTTTLGPTTTATGTAGSTGSTSAGSATVGLDLPPEPEYVAIEIEPADPVLEILDGQLPPPLAFTAYGVKADDTKQQIYGSWDFDRFDLADMDPTMGVLTVKGDAGGVGTVTFTWNGMQATTSATIKYHVTDDPEGVDPAVKQVFGGAIDPDPSMQWLYPYDQTVFPRGITGPVLQWNGGNAGDLYYVHLEADTFEFEGWQTVDPPSRYTLPVMPVDAWLKLTDSVVGEVKVSVQRYDGGTAYLPKITYWNVADANLTGIIYYWEVNNGSVVRITPGASAPETFLQPPPGVTCIACHSVSRDGNRIVASFNGGASPWGTFEASTGVNLFASGASSGFQAISPDGAYVIWRHWSDGTFNTLGSLVLSTYDSTTQLALLDPPDPGAPAHPAWSPDGEKVAFSVRTDGNGLDFTQSTLWLATVDLITPQFTDIVQVATNDPSRPTVTYPTFAPDSQWIAFMRATQARTRGAQGELWITNLDGSAQMELSLANGMGAIPVDQQSANYEPTFMPVAAGGYFWVVFVSERQYGNILTDQNVNSRRKQLWVAAIDANPTPGVDPSHPAFWLPGQEIDNHNMRGNWALSPCKDLGEACEAGFECCGGFCVDDGMGGMVCGDKPDTCSMLGDACDDASDCCDPNAQCIGDFCSIIPG